MTVQYNKFRSFVAALGSELHNLGSDTLQIALCNADNAPVNSNTVLADLVQIAYTNLSTQVITTTSWSQALGLAKLILADLTLTASGAVATFRYVVIFNQSAPNDELICWFDKGVDVSMVDTDTFLCDFNQSDGVLQLE